MIAGLRNDDIVIGRILQAKVKKTAWVLRHQSVSCNNDGEATFLHNRMWPNPYVGTPEEGTVFFRAVRPRPVMYTDSTDFE